MKPALRGQAAVRLVIAEVWSAECVATDLPTGSYVGWDRDAATLWLITGAIETRIHPWVPRFVPRSGTLELRKLLERVDQQIRNGIANHQRKLRAQ